ncbi:MAG: precorrin-8X methylmutase [Andreesenia angusta]|nr:precorrin-8X methylmutase [Andreesenia angusta]
MYIKNPTKIEDRSFEIIGAHMIDKERFNEDELKVVMRTIHTTGDYDYENIVKFKNNPIEIAKEKLKSGAKIITDTKMAFSGINKKALEKLNCTVENYIDREEVYKISKEKGITRSMAAIDFSAELGADIYLVGNAPTALYRIGELIEDEKIKPSIVIAVPVGFVGAAESKEYIRNFNIPTITTVGNKGGSNVAASIINALMYMLVER